MKNLYVKPDYTTALKIKKVRKNSGMTQKEFAAFVNVSTPTVERWEASNKEIHGPIALLTEILSRNPEIIESRLIPEKKYPIRMWYMYKDEICTLIDVHPMEEMVRIKNYQKNLVFRAFGKNEQPTYQQYEDFLESRCFPRERDKMKIILQELNLPFYDPFMIIEKTEGRMAEDDFWIRIERNDHIKG